MRFCSPGRVGDCRDARAGPAGRRRGKGAENPGEVERSRLHQRTVDVRGGGRGGLRLCAQPPPPAGPPEQTHAHEGRQFIAEENRQESDRVCLQSYPVGVFTGRPPTTMENPGTSTGRGGRRVVQKSKKDKCGSRRTGAAVPVVIWDDGKRGGASPD